ncbi:hypothetical protein L204_101921 [Cryptococcus depauperatus]|nr:hypothetical protein L204_05571 [Cryptococcus depauperatus CBS 7855]
MSFIGSGELEHKITQLQRQLSHKDHELNSIKSEQIKKQEALEELKRGKQTAEYKLSDEADRALKAETTLQSKTIELSQLKLKLTNLEASLTQTSGKLKKEEKEREKIQDALDETLSRGSDTAVAQITGQQARIKQLEDTLKRVEEERDMLCTQGSSNGSWGTEQPLNHRERIKLMALQNENAELKSKLENMSIKPSSTSTDSFETISPSRQRGKRRSLSVSASDVRELEIQVDNLKIQLSNIKRDYDKAVNEKLAIEISTKKSAEKLENELDEAKRELEYYRCSQGDADSKQIDQLKKDVQAAYREKEHLNELLRDKEAEAQKQMEEMTKLKEEVSNFESLNQEFENGRQARHRIEQSKSSNSSFDEEKSLDKIVALEAELERARVASATFVPKSANPELRQVRRELQKALRDKEYLESLVKENDELLAEKDEEISKMRAAIPIPSSPTFEAQHGYNRLGGLESGKEDLLHDLDAQLEQHAKEMQKLRVELMEKNDELMSARSCEGSIKAQQEVLSADLQKALETLDMKEAQSQQLSEQLAMAKHSLTEQQSLFAIAQQEVVAASQQLSEAKAKSAESESLLQNALQQKNQMEITLTTRNHDDTEFEELLSSVRVLEDELEKIGQDLSEAKAAGADAIVRLELAEKANKIAADMEHGLQLKADEAQQHANTRLELQKAESREQIDSLMAQLTSLSDEAGSLRIQIEEKSSQLEVAMISSQQLRDCLEQSHNKISNLQTRLAEMETEAEELSSARTEEKDEEIKHLKEQKMALEVAAKRMKREYEAQLSATRHDHEQELQDAHTRVAELDHQITALRQSAPLVRKSSLPEFDRSEVHKWEEKLERLRTERNDLRQNVAFVQHECHFAVQAADAEKQAALQEANRIQEELNSKSDVCDELQKEINGLKIEMDEKQVTSIEKKEKLESQVAFLEKDLASIRYELESKHKRISELELQALIEEDTIKKAETRAESLQRELNEVLHHLVETRTITTERQDSIAPKNPEDHSHQSGEAIIKDETIPRPPFKLTSPTSMVFNTQTEKDLQAKIDRRNARISMLSNDLSKTKSNLILLQSAQEEIMAENVELEGKCDKLRAGLDEMRLDDSQNIQSLVLAIVVHCQQARTLKSRWFTAQDSLRQLKEDSERLQAEKSAIENSLDSRKEHVSKLEMMQNMTLNELESTKKHVDDLGNELHVAQSVIDNLRARISEAEQASVTAAESALALANVEAQVAEKEDRIQQLREQNIELVSRLETMEQKLSAAQIGLEEHIGKLSTKVSCYEEQIAAAEKEVKEVKKEKEQLLESLAAAESALADGIAEADSQKGSLLNEQHKTQERLRELTKELEHKSEEISQLTEDTHRLEKLLEVEKLKPMEVTNTSDNYQASIDELQHEITELQEASRAAKCERQVVQKQLEEAEAKVNTLEQKVNSLNEESASQRLENKQAKAEVKDVSTLLAKAVAERDEISQEIVEAKAAVFAAKHTAYEKGEEITKLSEELRILQGQQETSEKRVEESDQHLAVLQQSLSNLREENDKLKGELSQLVAETLTSKVDEQLVIDLKERIGELEAALTQKNTEVDEADDQTREAFKVNAKLEKKIGKLQRQLVQAQVDANTVLNKLMSSQPVAPAETHVLSAPTTSTSQVTKPMPPPPIVASQPASFVNEAVATRSSRSIPSNIFSPPTAPSSGHKRHREIDEVEVNPRPAEAIMQAPSTSMSSRKILGNRASFTPQRGNILGPKTTKLKVGMDIENTIIDVKKSVDMSKNIFAKPPPTSGDPVKRTAFPLPPSRTPFAPAPRNAS